MCGIVGLFLKDPALESRLGRLTAAMLHEMRERGPDSAGFAVYGPARNGETLVVLDRSGAAAWPEIAAAMGAAIGAAVDCRPVGDHGVFQIDGAAGPARDWLALHHPDLVVLSYGKRMQIFKGRGDPDAVALRFGLAEMTGSHALAHTRMATESAVVTEGSHPFATAPDQCLVHNGSLSNHNRLRRDLVAEGIRFETQNDSEVAAAFVSARLAEGASLAEALEAGLKELDGFYTFAVATADGLAILRDPIACKPAVLAETDQWVAMASEFRAIAALPGVESARIWEPEPGVVHAWSHTPQDGGRQAA